MIQKTVLLIEDSREFAELIRRWLLPQDDIEFVLDWSDSLVAGLNRLTKGGVDAILLDLGLPDSRGLATFNTARMHAPNAPIIILSSGDKESLAVQMVQRGAQDYIIKDICDSALLVKALKFAVGMSSRKALEETAADQGKLIGVMGAKGGVGATTFACNLAIELRRATGQDLLLADLDVTAGLVDFLMNTEAECSILDVIASGPHVDPLNPAFWDDIVASGPDGVDIIRSPRLQRVDPSDGRRIQDALALIRTFYPWAVLDLGRMTGLSVSLLSEVSELYLVTNLSVSALYEAKRTIGGLAQAGLAEERLRLIVNEGGTTHISGTELRALFGIPVYASLPGAAQELDDACGRRRLLGVHTRYRTEMAILARKIARLDEEKSGRAAS